MNQIVPKTVNFAELVKNGKTTLSLDCESKLVDRLSKEFTEQEQQWYIANLFVYMNYHPTNDYPINLENVFKMIGFAHKENAKRTLKNNFIKEDDYKVFLRTDGNLINGKNIGGRPSEEIMLNIDTFKNLCMMAKTDKGKEIRKYYVKLENIYNSIIKEELSHKQQQLDHKEKELQTTKKELEKKSKLTQKKWYDSEPGHTVYGFISNEGESNSLITIGKSKNIKKRESEYMTHNQSGKMFYIRKCYNCDLTEKVLHHILDKYRCERNREWFDISESLAIYVIDLVCDFLDTFIGCSEKLPEYKLKEFIQDLQIDHVDYKLTFEEETPIQERIPDIVVNENIKDYEKFLQDCCDIGDEKLFALPSEVVSAYRIWCKGEMTKTHKTECLAYIKNKFPTKEMFLANLGTRSTVLIGITPKDLGFQPDDINELTMLEKFCIQECVTNYSYKINMDEFVDTYKQWLEKRGANLDDNTQEIRNRLSKQFLIDYHRNVCYIWGIQLKTSPLPTYHSRQNACNKIFQIDFETKEVTHIIDGLAEASRKFSLLPEILSHKIRYKKPFVYQNKRILLVYDKPNLEHIGVKRNVLHKPIYKFDLESKTLIESYKTIVEAAEKNGLHKETIAKYIKKQQIFNTKRDGDAKVVLTHDDTFDDETVIKIKQQNDDNTSGVIRIRPRKIIQKVDYETNEVLDTFHGILDAATKLQSGTCTVCRHLKSGKKLKMKKDGRLVLLRYG